jgi:PTS system nitrogen regulatory IIA component
MRLSELVNEAAVRIPLQAASKAEAIRELVDVLESAHGITSNGEIVAQVLRRESLMSTGIGNGVAIPHGKMKTGDTLLASCGVSQKGVDFDSVDGQPATLFILLVSPEASHGPHVRTLANVSRLLKDESVRNTLRSSTTSREFLQRLQEAEERLL